MLPDGRQTTGLRGQRITQGIRPLTDVAVSLWSGVPGLPSRRTGFLCGQLVGHVVKWRAITKRAALNEFSLKLGGGACMDGVVQ